MTRASSTPVPSSKDLRFEHIDRTAARKGLDKDFRAVVESAQKTARDLHRLVEKSKRS
ncbi:MAG: hypothetical protein JWO57_332 [Pseudonocardiales bacterium]|nr:hypothetical protein [Pseudonocardiales bacterium]